MYFWLPLVALAGLTIASGAAAPLTVRLISVGSLPPILLGFLQEGLARELGAVVRIAGNLPLPASCPEGRSQYPGEPFLAALAAARPPGEEVILGVTGVDLTVPGLNFVFGLADPPTRARRHLPGPPLPGILRPAPGPPPIQGTGRQRGGPRTGAPPGPGPLPRSGLRHVLLQLPGRHRPEGAGVLRALPGALREMKFEGRAGEVSPPWLSLPTPCKGLGMGFGEG